MKVLLVIEQQSIYVILFFRVDGNRSKVLLAISNIPVTVVLSSQVLHVLYVMSTTLIDSESDSSLQYSVSRVLCPKKALKIRNHETSRN